MDFIIFMAVVIAIITVTAVILGRRGSSSGPEKHDSDYDLDVAATKAGLRNISNIPPPPPNSF